MTTKRELWAALEDACVAGDEDSIRALVEGDLDINGHYGPAGACPIMISVQFETCRAITPLLVNLGADLETADRGGRTPLLYAVEASFMPGIRVLLELGADINGRNHLYGTPPLMNAVAKAPLERELIEFLLGRGADPDLAANNGCTARESLTGRYEVIRDGKVVPIQVT